MGRTPGIPRTSKPAPDEARLLLVHPSLWMSLESWLNGVRIELVRLPQAEDEPVPTFRTELMDGEWPDA